MVALSATSASSGYDGTINEKQLAALLPKVGSCEYGVAGDTDFQVSPVAGTDRGLLIRAGTAWGHSVVDVSDADVSVQLGAVSSGSRWDLIVLRRDWQPAAGVTTVEVIPGTSDKTQSAAGSGKRETRPGVLDEQPLALVRVTAGSTVIAEVIDLRCWASNGGVFAVDSLALGYLAKPGARVRIGPVDWGYIKGSGGFGWDRVGGGRAIPYGGVNGPWKNPAPAGGFIHSITIPDPGFPYTVQAHAIVEASGGGSGTRWDVQIRVAGWDITNGRGDVVAPWWVLSGVYYRVITGPTTVTLHGRRVYGSGAFGLSSFNRFLTAVVLPA